MASYLLKTIKNKKVKFILEHDINLFEKKEVESLIEKKEFKITDNTTLYPGDLISRFGKESGAKGRNNVRSFVMKEGFYLEYVGYIDNHLIFNSSYPDHFVTFQFAGFDYLLFIIQNSVFDIRALDDSKILRKK